MPSARKHMGYTERLFSAGLRGWLHNARFLWLQKQTTGLSGSVIELGCHDGRAIDYLGFRPGVYLGLDANWERGIQKARIKYPYYDFIVSETPDHIVGNFDIAIAMETLEHVPRCEMPVYIERLAKAAPVLFASVPVEIGPVFAFKYLLKPSHSVTYNPLEFMLETLGSTQYVEQDQHKGFNYFDLLHLLRKHYHIESVQGLPLPLPGLLNFTVAIRASRRCNTTRRK